MVHVIVIAPLPTTYQPNLDLDLARLILNELVCQHILLTNLT